VRAAVEGLASPYRFAELLPAIYQEDAFACRWVSGFDDVLAPIVSVLDNIEAYFDATVAPPDFLEYLASWVGVELDETWTEPARREFVARAVELVKARGTLEGLRRLVEIYTGATPEIEESGGCSVSIVANGPLPGRARQSLVVRVRAAPDRVIDEARLSRLVASAKPAHVPHRVEVFPP
jgi:phage tail-like protein